MSLHLYVAPYLDEEHDLYIALELDDEEQDDLDDEEDQERIEDDDG
jgi:hypothetical protein